MRHRCRLAHLLGVAMLGGVPGVAVQAGTIDPALRLDDGVGQEIVVCLRDRSGRFARDAFGSTTRATVPWPGWLRSSIVPSSE